MEEIHPIRIRRLRIASLLQLFADVETAITDTLTLPADKALIQPELTTLMAGRARLEARYGKPKSSLITAVITAADLRRDNAVSCIGGIVRGHSFSANAARKEAAHSILHYLDPYGNISDKAYAEQTTAITSLLEKLRNTLAADIITLNLSDEVQELQLANDAFSNASDARDAENPNAGDAPNLTELRPAAEAAFKALCKQVEAVCNTTRQAAPWPTLVGIFNNIIDRYKVLLRRQAGNDEEE